MLCGMVFSVSAVLLTHQYHRFPPQNHRARIGAVFQCAAFFCRLKASSGAGGGGRHSPFPTKGQQRRSQQQQPSGSPRAGGTISGDGEDSHAPLLSSALADMPAVCRGELRRRLATLLASFQCPRALAREEVDAMRRNDLLVRVLSTCVACAC